MSWSLVGSYFLFLIFHAVWENRKLTLLACILTWKQVSIMFYFYNIYQLSLDNETSLCSCWYHNVSADPFYSLLWEYKQDIFSIFMTKSSPTGSVHTSNWADINNTIYHSCDMGNSSLCRELGGSSFQVHCEPRKPNPAKI